jgi:hypothetical protein
MKKTKKFEDGGPTGGRYVDMGESRNFVADVPDAVADAPVAAGIGPVRNGPMGGSVGAGLDGIQDAAGRTETLLPFLNNEPRPISRPIGAGISGLNELNASSPPATIMPFVAGNNGPEPIRRPIGQLMPPRGRGLGASMAGMGGMKKGGTVKKMAKGGSVSSASKRADGCAIKGKTKGRII